MRETMPDLRQIKERSEEMEREAEVDRLARSVRGKTTKGRIHGLASAFFEELKADAKRLRGVVDASSGSKKR